VPDYPRWLVLGSLALAVAGLAISAYLTLDHYTTIAPLACPNTGAINCVKVTTSTYSTLVGVPVALLGLLFYIAMVALCTPPAWRRGAPQARVRVVAAGLGVAFVLYLIWAELFKINAICLWCTGVHIITVVLFGFLLIGQSLVGARTLQA
jgi:uncharacterized membrane protein